MKIIGAGLSGLLAGVLFPTAEILERNPRESYQNHDSLLRFRSPAVGLAVGIPFRKARVYKAVWSGMGFRTVTPCIANAYAQKVSGRILPRSIWDLSPVDRYIAPGDFQTRLREICDSRIQYGVDFDPANPFLSRVRPVISTIPMPKMAAMAGIHAPFEYGYNAITTLQFSIPNCEAYQTIYYPDPTQSVYRASITGSTLIIEAMGVQDALPDAEIDEVLVSFGIERGGPILLASSSREFGKIAPIPDDARKDTIHHLTKHYNIYSAGRFAIWKNILMDDLLDDLQIIRRLIHEGEYGRTLHSGRA